MRHQKISEITYKNTVTRRARNKDGEDFDETVEYLTYESITTVSTRWRLFHYIIDMIIILAIYFMMAFAAGIVLGLLGLTSLIYKYEAVFNLSFYPVFLLYYALTEHFLQGSIGKLICGNKVIDEYGEKPSLKETFIRSISRFVPLDGLSIFFSDRPWHDKWSDTYVVSKKYLDELKLKMEINDLNGGPSKNPFDE
ncbi:MAG: RDD family protein [Bacteroidota bacterium]